MDNLVLPQISVLEIKFGISDGIEMFIIILDCGWGGIGGRGIQDYSADIERSAWLVRDSKDRVASSYKGVLIVFDSLILYRRVTTIAKV